MRLAVLILSLCCLALLANALGGAWAFLLGKNGAWTRIAWALPCGLLCGVGALYLTKKHGPFDK